MIPPANTLLGSSISRLLPKDSAKNLAKDVFRAVHPAAENVDVARMMGRWFQVAYLFAKIYTNLWSVPFDLFNPHSWMWCAKKAKINFPILIKTWWYRPKLKKHFGNFLTFSFFSGIPGKTKNILFGSSIQFPPLNRTKHMNSTERFSKDLRCRVLKHNC